MKFQGNGAFVFDHESLKGKGDWLCTDLGSFVNKGQSGRIMNVKGRTITNSVRLPRQVQDRPPLEMGQYVVMTTYWKHAKYTDFCRMTTVVHSPLWKRVIAWERSRAASGYGIIWGDADRNKQEEFGAECHSMDCF